METQSNDSSSDIDQVLENIEEIKAQIQQIHIRMDVYTPIIDEFLIFKKEQGSEVAHEPSLVKMLQQEMYHRVAEAVLNHLSPHFEDIKELRDKFREYEIKVREIQEYCRITMSETSDKVEVNQDNIRVIKHEISSQDNQLQTISDTLLEKASVEDMKYALSQIEQLTPIYLHRNLEQRFNEKPNHEDIYKVEKQLLLFQTRVDQTLSQFMRMTQFDQFIKQCQFSTKTELSNAQKSIQGNIDKVGQRMDQFNEQQNRDSQRLKFLYDELSKKSADRPWERDFSQLMQKLKDYITPEQFQTYRLEITNTIIKFQEYIDGFTNDNQTFKHSLERFDEILLQKSSKLDFQNLQLMMSQKATKIELGETQQNITTIVSNLNTAQSNLKTQFDQIMYDLKEYSISAAIRERKFMQIDMMLNEIESIKDQLTSKADRIDLITLSNRAALRTQTEQISSLQEKLQKQVHNCVMLVGEFVKSQVKITDESQTAKKQHNIQLYKYAHHMMK